MAQLSPFCLSQLQDLACHQVVSSTNDVLLNHHSPLDGKFLVCLAEQQTQGRGRLGRSWASPFGQNIYLSLLFHFEKEAAELSGLSLALATSLIATLSKLGIQDLSIKWPNDLLWQSQKLVGILVELRSESDANTAAVIGIGLNLNLNEKFHQNFSYPATDLTRILGQTPNRNTLSATLLNDLIPTVLSFQAQGLAPFLADFNQVDHCLNRSVTLNMPQGKISGIGRGIDERGYFLLENEAGHIQHFASGEISLRLNTIEYV